MKLYIAVQSVSDLITNSSSEVFLVKTNTPEETKKMLLEIGKGHEFHGGWEEWEKLPEEEKAKYDDGSGMGMEFTVETWKETYERHKSYIPENKQDLYTPEVWSISYKESLDELKNRLVIDIDWERKATIDWIIQNLFVYGIDSFGYFQVDPNTGRYLKRVSEEEWEKLPENERNND